MESILFVFQLSKTSFEGEFSDKAKTKTSIGFLLKLKHLGLNFTLFFSQLGLSVRGREDNRFNLLFTKR